MIRNSLRKSINDILPISVNVNSDQHVSLPNGSEAPVSTSDDAHDDDDRDAALQSVSIESSSENPAKQSKLCSNEFKEKVVMRNEL